MFTGPSEVSVNLSSQSLESFIHFKAAHSLQAACYSFSSSSNNTSAEHPTWAKAFFYQYVSIL